MKEFSKKARILSQGEVYIKILSLKNGLIVEREKNKYVINNIDDYMNIRKIINKIQLNNPEKKHKGIRYKFTDN